MLYFFNYKGKYFSRIEVNNPLFLQKFHYIRVKFRHQTMSLFSIKPTQERIGIAFSGGGARGFAHAGALKALEEMGIKPDVVAGVSAGSVIAVLYSAGINPSDMIDIFGDIKFSTCCELSLNGGGIFKIDRFLKFIASQTKAYRNIEDLPITTHICATDFDHGVPHDFTSGPIPERIGASCAIPIIFKPMRIDGVNYVDGGVLRNLPAWAIRSECTKLIGINCSPMGEDERYKNTLVDVAQHAYRLMAKNNVSTDVEMCDIVVETRDIAHYKVFNMKEIKKVYQSGYDAMMRAAEANPWLSDHKH